MGSSMSHIMDEQEAERRRETRELEDKIANENEEWLITLAETILKTDVRSAQFADLKWLVDNKDKIMRNRQLIDIIG